MSMDDVLSDKKPEPVVVEPAPEPTPEPVAAAPEPVKAEPAPEPAKVEPEPIDETTGMTPKEKAFYKNAREETRKRQEEVQKREQVERDFAALKAKIEQEERAKQSVIPQNTEQPKDFWEDPEGALNKYREEMTNLTVTTRLNTAEMIARSKYQDFDQNVEVFAQIMRNTPGLQQQWINSPDPAEFAYRTGKNYHDLQQAGNMDNLKAKLEQELRIKLEAEYKAKEEAKRAALDNIPPSLTNVRNTGANKPVWSGPPPLDDILH